MRNLFLGEAGYHPQSIDTSAEVEIEKQDGGFVISKIHLDTKAKVPGIDEATFREHAEQAKKNCPVSQALSGPETTLSAALN